MALMASFKSFYDGIGRVRIHMTVAIIMNLINIFANYFLIYGFSSLMDRNKRIGRLWGRLGLGYIKLCGAFYHVRLVLKKG